MVLGGGVFGGVGVFLSLSLLRKKGVLCSVSSSAANSPKGLVLVRVDVNGVSASTATIYGINRIESFISTIRFQLKQATRIVAK